MKIRLNSVLVGDQDRALQYYTETLGFRKKLDLPMGKFCWLTAVSPEEPDAAELVLEPNAYPGAAAYQVALFEAGIPLTAFQVDDIDLEYQRLTALGVEFRASPTDADGATIAVLDDTCGNLLQIYQTQ